MVPAPMEERSSAAGLLAGHGEACWRPWSKEQGRSRPRESRGVGVLPGSSCSCGKNRGRRSAEHWAEGGAYWLEEGEGEAGKTPWLLEKSGRHGEEHGSLVAVAAMKKKREEGRAPWKGALRPWSFCPCACTGNREKELLVAARGGSE